MSFSHLSSDGAGTLQFPEFDGTQTGPGLSIGADCDRASALFASVRLGRLSLEGATSEREKHLPADLEPLTPKTITDRAALAEELEVTRERGYAIDNEENTLGLRCFAVALPYVEPATDAISASIPLARLTPEREVEVIEALRQASDKIARVVGPMSQSLAWG